MELIESLPFLAIAEEHALGTLLARTLAAESPPILRALLFGSKARGDFDDDSDIDLLLICDISPGDREEASQILARDARIVSRETGLRIEPWAVAAADLDEGWRTPMLVDAIADGINLWPCNAPAIQIAFTPADARFCARCLLDWIDAGGPIVRRALDQRKWASAARRTRDDITRLASAALLLVGETRHRRADTLARFAERFVSARGLPAATVLPALRWAAAAYPTRSGRGISRLPATPEAIASAPHGFQLASVMISEVAPLVRARIADDDVAPTSLAAIPPRAPLPWAASHLTRSGINRPVVP